MFHLIFYTEHPSIFCTFVNVTIRKTIMSIFTILVIIFIIVPVIKSVVKHFNEQKSDPSAYDWNRLYSSRLRSILSSYNNFRSEETIDSAIGFYLFSYNDDAKEFIFIQEEDIAFIHHISYHQLIGYNIRNTQDYGIYIDLDTTIPNKKHISIKCFEREDAIKKISYLTLQPAEINNLYQIEAGKVEDVEYILQMILEENEKTKQPPIYEKEIPILEEPVTNEILSDIPPLPSDYEIQIIEENKEVIASDVEEPTPAFEELIIDEVLEEPLYNEEIEPENPVISISDKGEGEGEGEKATEIESDGRIPVALSDIDNYTKGKFLDWEIQSAVGDAKIKGQRFIYLTSEQLEKLQSE